MALLIDSLAHANRLRQVHPAEKFAFAIGSLLICLVLPSLGGSLACLAFMILATVLAAGVPWTAYLKLLSVPLAFIVTGVATVAVSVTTAQGVYVRPDGLVLAGQILLRTLATVSCLYFLALTTPLVEILSVLRRCRVPPLLVELMALTYRCIFILLETSHRIQTAQASRLGYRTLSTTYRSLGYLGSNLFVNALVRVRQMNNGLLSRCYQGELCVLEPEYTLSKRNLTIIAGIEALILGAALLSGGR